MTTLFLKNFICVLLILFSFCPEIITACGGEVVERVQETWPEDTILVATEDTAQSIREQEALGSANTKVSCEWIVNAALVQRLQH